MKVLVFLFFLLIGLPSFSQSIKDTSVSGCTIDSLTASRDIQSGRIKFYCYGSIAPAAMTTQDKQFEKTYSISYIQLGCQPFGFGCMRSYNHAIAAFLDEKFGRDWRKKVRKDIYGVTK